jgi:hypothetical protein
VHHRRLLPGQPLLSRAATSPTSRGPPLSAGLLLSLSPLSLLQGISQPLAWSLLIRLRTVPSSALTRAARAPRPCMLTPSGPLPPELPRAGFFSRSRSHRCPAQSTIPPLSIAPSTAPASPSTSRAVVATQAGALARPGGGVALDPVSWGCLCALDDLDPCSPRLRDLADPAEAAQ